MTLPNDPPRDFDDAPTTPDSDSESDLMLMALADGELDDATAARLRDRVAQDPALAARLAIFATGADSLRAAYPPEPVPDHLVAMIRAAPAPKADGGVVAFRPRRRAVVWRGAAGMGLAASVLLAVGVGGFMVGRGAGPVASPLVAAAAALSDTVTGGAADLPGGGTARALASYDTDLGLCRLIEAGADRGLVCRADAAAPWTVTLAVAGMGADAYLPASDLGTGLIDLALDEMGAGPALDPATEAAALD